MTLDISGAYNCVLRNRLAKRLLEQGWHPTLVRLVVTFATERTTRQRDDPEGDRTVSSRLPQGLPLSPIAFLLYVEPILKLTVDIRHNYGYVDDVGFLR